MTVGCSKFGLTVTLEKEKVEVSCTLLAVLNVLVTLYVAQCAWYSICCSISSTFYGLLNGLGYR